MQIKMAKVNEKHFKTNLDITWLIKILLNKPSFWFFKINNKIENIKIKTIN